MVGQWVTSPEGYPTAGLWLVSASPEGHQHRGGEAARVLALIPHSDPQWVGLPGVPPGQAAWTQHTHSLRGLGLGLNLRPAVWSRVALGRFGDTSDVQLPHLPNEGENGQVRTVVSTREKAGNDPSTAPGTAGLHKWSPLTMIPAGAGEGDGKKSASDGTCRCR